MNASRLITSPTFSASSSAYDVVSPRDALSPHSPRSPPSASLSIATDEDYIVYNVSDRFLSSTHSNTSTEYYSDDDFVLLEGPGDTEHSVSPPQQPTTRQAEPVEIHYSIPKNTSGLEADRALSLENPETPDSIQLTPQLQALTLSNVRTPSSLSKPSGASEKKKAKKAKKVKAQAKKGESSSMPLKSIGNTKGTTPKTKSAKRRKRKLEKSALNIPATTGSPVLSGLGLRPVVDDLSARQTPVQDDSSTAASLYEEAAAYISSYLSNPEAKTNMACRLTLLQSLIIELGLTNVASTLPCTLKAAKRLLKSRAFLNVKEYISVRSQGPEAVRKLLYPSRSALVKDIRRKRNAASLKWVKEHGLQVLLVSCFR